MTPHKPSTTTLLGTVPADARQRRYFPAILVVTAEFIAYLLCVAGAVILPWWWLKGVCVLAATVLVGFLYVIAHDAGHGSFVPGRRANRWVARLAFFPTFTPLAAWVRAHVLLHHNFLRVRGRDMVWIPWTAEEYRNASVWRRGWYRLLRTPIGLTFYWTVGNWIPYLLFPPREGIGTRHRQNWFDRFLVIGFAVAMFSGLFALTQAAEGWSWADPVGPLGVVLFGLVLPYLGFTYQIALVDLVHHMHPQAICFSTREDWDYYTATVESTTHVVLPFGLNRFMHNILEHTAHHVDPRIPLYNLPRVQDILEAAYPTDISVERLTPGYLLRILRTCRLYDYDRRQWLDYDGTPTTPARRPEGSPTVASS